MTLFSIVIFLHLLTAKLKKSKSLLFLSFTVLFILLAYRGVTVGTDTQNYELQFKAIKNFGILNIEPLWLYLNKLVVYLGGDFKLVLIFSALLTLLPIYYVAYKKSPYPLLSILLYMTLYYYFFSFNIMRQGVAMSFGLLSLMFFIDEKWKKSLLFLVIASLFHYSALILLPGLVFIYFSERLKKIPFVVLQFFTLFIGLFFYQVLLSFATKYLYSNYEIEQYLNFLGNFISALIINVIFFATSRIIKVKDKWFYLSLCFILVSNLLVRIPFGNRFGMFYGIVFIIYLPLLINNNTLEKKDKSLVFILIVLFALYSFYTNIGKGEILPYINTLF